MPYCVKNPAETLITRVLTEQGLGKYCDAEFIRNTSREMQDALDLTVDEMNTAANHIILQEKQDSSENQQASVESLYANRFHAFHQPPIQQARKINK